VKNAQGPGLKSAASALQAMREWLSAEQIVVSFKIGDDIIDMAIDENGVGLYCDGQAVPMVEGMLR